MKSFYGSKPKKGVTENIMRKLLSLIMLCTILLMGVSAKSYGLNEKDRADQPLAAKSQWVREYDFMDSINHDRDITTVSLNLIAKTSEKGEWSFFKGFTLTRPEGEIDYKGETLESTAFGIGPMGLARYKLRKFEKLTVHFDLSGALIFYNEKFPAGGRHYNFMWRIGPQFVYDISENFLLNLGYKLMHVSNGYLTGYRNPAYDSEGFSVCLVRLF